MAEGVGFGGLWILSLLSADDVVLLASSNSDLQLVLGQFTAKSEAAGLRIITSKCEVLVLNQKRVDCPPWEDFKYLRVLFTSEGKIEREIDR